MADKVLIPITPDLLDETTNARNKTVVLANGEVLERIQFANMAKELGLEENSFEFKAITPASPAPTKTGLYFPMSAGKYPNFGNIEITEEQFNSSFIFIVFDGTGFQILIKPIDFIPTGKIEENETNAVSGGVVWSKKYINSFIQIKNLRNLGFNTFLKDLNLLEEYANSSIEDEELWGKGFLRDNGVIESSDSYIYSKNFIPMIEGIYDVWLRFSGNSRLVYYDSTDKVIGSFASPTSPVYQGKITAPKNTAYFRFSFGGIYEPNIKQLKVSSDFSFLEIDAKNIISDAKVASGVVNPVSGDTVYKMDYLQKRKVSLELSNEGVEFDKLKYLNLLEEYANSSIEDEELWGKGFLRDNGSVTISEGWYHSLKKILITEGVYDIRIRFSGNSRLVYYDSTDKVIGSFASPTSPVYQGKITAPKNTAYFRFSFGYFQSGNESDILLLKCNSEKTELKKYNDRQNVDLLLKMSVNKVPQPVISFIADDGANADKGWYLDVLNEFNIKSTFAIITGRLPKNVSGYFNVEDVKMLYEQGHDIAGHTHTHVNGGLKNQTKEEIENELYKCSYILRGIDDRIKAKMFVSPYGAWGGDINSAISRYFSANFITVGDGFIGTNNELNLPCFDRLMLHRTSFDNGAGEVGMHKSRIELLKKSVDNLITNKKGWLVFAIHPAYLEYTDQNSIDRKQELKDLITYIKSKEIPILTANQAYDIYKNKIEIGNEYINRLKYYTIGMDGSEKGNFF